MSTPKRIKKKSAPGADYTRDEAAALAAALVASQVQRERLVAERDEAKENAARPYRGPIDSIDAEIKDGMARLEAWANANGEIFGDARSVVLPGGNRIGWRLGNWAAKTMKGWTWEKVRDHLLGLPKSWREQFLRVKVDVNKEAIVAARAVCEWSECGVEFHRAESFYLEPSREEGGRIA